MPDDHRLTVALIVAALLGAPASAQDTPAADSLRIAAGWDVARYQPYDAVLSFPVSCMLAQPQRVMSFYLQSWAVEAPLYFSSSNPAVANVPPSVPVAAGSSAAGFTYPVSIPPNDTSSVTSAIIRGTFGAQTIVDTVLVRRYRRAPRRESDGILRHAFLKCCRRSRIATIPVPAPSSLREGRLSWNDARFLTHSALPRLAECSPQCI